ncbi:isopeptide-forming domain-containing fimbrial protein [Enterococcus faecalis]|uniref:isopeptide-forming domain-containing fimbrial protein n=1 Tax=Enterococcus TaxID=1350 RepID=UPI00070CC8CA|nr:isopeptide-forming domain-containing fimbrial protein [Enterococcus faecalis]KXF71662.1 cell surface protein [Enterococcus faecalis]KXF73964.1 cell surface protein [Enterococcus faecalis]MBC2812590.1 isopeptide-forming domain-containing fimbrial protein [Enterococcus faecalis]MBC2816490.1 isopeptide-forming domain-containing fimbrial protein [Enterococcus faecalis]MBC2819491.1 isopeptide-forming domain-containing fimbrial protein [Enterococcus faecalis]
MKKTTIIQGLATVTILASMAMPMMAQAQEGGPVPDEVAQTFFQRTQSNSILNAPKASLVKQGDEVSAKYSFIAKFIKGVTTVSTGGEGWTNDVYVNRPPQKWDGKIGLDTTKAKKGQSWIRYNNVGTADDGTVIDLKITIQDWKPFISTINGTNCTNNMIAFNNVSSIGTYQSAFDYVKYTWTYMEHGTENEKVVSGYFTYDDIDNLQGITFGKETYDRIDSLYVPTDQSIIKYKEEKDGGITFFDGADQPLDDYLDPRGVFTFLYSDSSSFDFTYSEDFATREQNTGRPIPANNNNQYAYFGYSAKKILPTAPLIPTKTVTDSDETNVDKNTLTGLGEAYTYTITHKVPDEIADFYYSNYEMQDELIPELERVSDVKVIDEAGNDVTGKFEAKHEGNLVKMVAKADVLKQADFYNHEYKFEFQTKIREGASLDSYLVDGQLQLPNKAKVIQNNREVATDETHTTVTPKEPSIAKKILEGDKEVDLTSVKVGDEVTFKLDVQVPNTKDMTSLVIQDDLEDVLEANKEVKVTLSDGTDITDQGVIGVDEKTQKITWAANEPNKLKEKQLFVYIKGKLKDADFSQYVTDTGKILIPNVAQLVINNEPTDSNKVNVETPDIDQTPVKSVLDKDGKETELTSGKKGEKVSFTVKNTAPYAAKGQAVTLSDDLENVLDLQEKEVKVEVKNGDQWEDITSQGTFANNAEEEIVSWTLADGSVLAGKEYRMTIVGTLKKDVDYSAYMDKTGNILIPNVAKETIGTQEKATNQVQVAVQQEKPTLLPATGTRKTKESHVLPVVASTSILSLAGYLFAKGRR